ncbi:unnamed protein product [Caenorhabditis auriculariae]|uniref:Uncharacterized protein n=1 Tax=Caenorhabditis auriculariae TaxID=2777116 RepID=A0A8S1H368_9PELO|nr:unnamed protein product [Caenorhabditis auriculariae]
MPDVVGVMFDAEPPPEGVGGGFGEFGEDSDDVGVADGLTMCLLCVTSKPTTSKTSLPSHGYAHLDCFSKEGAAPRRRCETNRLDEGMVLELWAKGVLWDKLIGVHYMPLTDVKYSNLAGEGKWLQMDHELETRNGQTVGTRGPTGHNLLVDVHFELPFDAQGEDGEELQAKLLALNGLIEHKR